METGTKSTSSRTPARQASTIMRSKPKRGGRTLPVRLRVPSRKNSMAVPSRTRSCT